MLTGLVTHGGPTTEQLVPEELHSWKECTPQHFKKDYSLWEGPTLESLWRTDFPGMDPMLEQWKTVRSLASEEKVAVEIVWSMVTSISHPRASLQGGGRIQE